jgi:hypothetical protein
METKIMASSGQTPNGDSQCVNDHAAAFYPDAPLQTHTRLLRNTHASRVF